MLEPRVLGPLVDALRRRRRRRRSRARSTSQDAASSADLLVEEPVPPAEAGVRTALTGLALFSIGDASSAVQFQRALQQSVAGAAPTQFLLGAARAMQVARSGRDRGVAGGDSPRHRRRRSRRELLIDAYLRRNDRSKRRELAAATRRRARVGRDRSAVAHIAARREAEAIAAARRASDRSSPTITDARWLLLHALYAQFVRGGKRSRRAADARARFTKQARAYIDAKGGNTPALADGWLNWLISSSCLSGGGAGGLPGVFSEYSRARRHR